MLHAADDFLGHYAESEGLVHAQVEAEAPDAVPHRRQRVVEMVGVRRHFQQVDFQRADARLLPGVQQLLFRRRCAGSRS